MGLFDNVLGVQQSKTAALGPAEAFAAVALVAIAADGYAADEELNMVGSVLMRMQLFRSYSADVIRRMFNKLVGILQRNGTEALLSAAIEALPHDLHATAFAIATDISLADGTISEEEQTFLSDLYNSLDISEDTATQIIEVMLIKNRG